MKQKCLTESAWNFAIAAVQRNINLIDLVKSYQTSIYYLLAKLGVDTAENGPLKVCQKLF